MSRGGQPAELVLRCEDIGNMLGSMLKTDLLSDLQPPTSDL